jgi:hypothetical protein
MQYKLSKEQWLEIGQKAGWFKIAQQEEKGRAFFVTASEEEIKKYIDSIEESSAQDLADNLAGERDMMRESANGARRAAMSADAGGDADDYRFQLKLEKQKIEVADKFAKALAMLTVRFPNVKTPEPAKLMDMADSMETLSQKEHEQSRSQSTLQGDAEKRLRLPGLGANTPR